LLFVVVGFLLVYSNVWHKDISPLLTTFGVGSLVLGLALQDTLGNLFAGLALVFERPIAVGDWIQVGDQIGRIQQINWRSVRIVTRELTEITIPNSAISKERIQNFSSPSRMHGFKVTCGFSYDAPPNVVKEMLCSAAAETPGIIPTPAPEARTQEFGAYAIQYDLRVFIGDFNDLIAIRNELMSRIWYSARRRGIGIPYPITTLYKTEIPYTPDHATRADSIMKAIKAAALFKELSAADMQQLAEETTLERFGSGERVIKEGDVGDCFYIIVEGRCSVMVNSKDSRLVPVATLEEGSVVGEMSLLSGNPRQASVFASSELLLARISKEALGHLLTRHPEMVQSFAHYTAERATEIGMALDKDSLEVTTSEATKVDEGALRERLRRFFGLG
jgi:CRP-like cAMP-binding protein